MNLVAETSHDSGLIADGGFSIFPPDETNHQREAESPTPLTRLRVWCGAPHVCFGETGPAPLCFVQAEPVRMRPLGSTGEAAR
jgi:hypothetical protein